MNFIPAVSALMIAASISVHAQQLPSACGPDATKYKVKTEHHSATNLASSDGQATVVVMQTLDGAFMSAPISRIATDGSWKGAVRGASYLSFPVAPGQHSICVSRQSTMKSEKANVGTLSINAQPGQVYFVQWKLARTEVGDLSRLGGSSLPQQYPGGMTAKDRDTTDTASLAALSSTEGESQVKNLAVAIPQAK